MSIGARSQSARTYLEKHLDSFLECSLEELIKHGLRALRDTLPNEVDLNTKVRALHTHYLCANRYTPFCVQHSSCYQLMIIIVYCLARCHKWFVSWRPYWSPSCNAMYPPIAGYLPYVLVLSNCNSVIIFWYGSWLQLNVFIHAALLLQRCAYVWSFIFSQYKGNF